MVLWKIVFACISCLTLKIPMALFVLRVCVCVSVWHFAFVTWQYYYYFHYYHHYHYYTLYIYMYYFICCHSSPLSFSHSIQHAWLALWPSTYSVQSEKFNIFDRNLDINSMRIWSKQIKTTIIIIDYEINATVYFKIWNAEVLISDYMLECNLFAYIAYLSILAL